ncbi:ChbG/HpnK family deacetylase [Paenibacillus sp. D2_2]|uniref:carbohydrate deacetylase n=1 Tax=Paenibacillus sp. D2_2 TaxID=3073092 RepID=UPI00281580C1|nr:ChbG/HpnK family deacetylase [Paenibacillus sp. D2_2]WMT41660.1 ChbG/HpnK family deacetylase [Paenibacillus sp. D2_2]
MNRQVIINADDFGLSPAVNRGIIEAFQAGGITSTSLMVNMPGFEDAVQLAHSYPDLSVGLHFNLTYGRPVSNPASIPSLVREDGAFNNEAIAREWDSRDISRELTAQWDRFVQTGLRPTHLDSHHLLHQLHPEIYKLMARKAHHEGIPLRRSQISHLSSGVPDPRMTNFILLDSYDGVEGRQRLRQHLVSLREGLTEIVCHPGYVDEALIEQSHWTDIREGELALFANPEVANTLAAIGVLPVNYRVLQRRKPPGGSRVRKHSLVSKSSRRASSAGAHRRSRGKGRLMTRRSHSAINK